VPVEYLSFFGSAAVVRACVSDMPIVARAEACLITASGRSYAAQLPLRHEELIALIQRRLLICRAEQKSATENRR
jgi:hypothetical protein